MSEPTSDPYPELPGLDAPTENQCLVKDEDIVLARVDPMACNPSAIWISANPDQLESEFEISVGDDYIFEAGHSLGWICPPIPQIVLTRVKLQNKKKK